MKKLLVAVVTGGALLVSGTPALAQTALGPYGYGKIRLGMSAKQARATGKVVLKLAAQEGSCSGWDLRAHPTGKNSVGLYISKRRGVAVIFAPKGVKTPAGIGIGSTMKQVKRAYPKVSTPRDGIPSASVPGNPKARYFFFPNRKGKLEELSIALITQDCVS
ncbi:hypothetical protein [Nonomuraea jiangxiensis]|uniref:Uncharacterized protein n=1 Tax=Nonomuraea jiangxiensis TaxID=633440 RepID=A0A1G9G5H6_9ACTN|nr:hypothetical protein [Nonomuraea jiangxiensis]SDK95847.1 hypothetical protein SAMN05421869_120180 [Nonomuraea jiangxiensis]